MKVTIDQINNACSEVECLDYEIIAIIASEPIEVEGELWDNFPPIAVHPNAKWTNELNIVIVGSRSTGTQSVHFELVDGVFKKLVSEEEYDKMWKGLNVR